MDQISTYTLISYLVSLLLIPKVLVTKKRHSVSTVAWILAIVLLPFVGCVLFLFFGINRVERRGEHKLRSNMSLARRLPSLSEHQLLSNEFDDPGAEVLSRVAQRVGGTFVTTGNTVEVLPDTHATLWMIEQAVQEARETIHLEYYIWQPDRSGTRLRNMLIAKAKEGVKIRFLYDSIGSLWLSERFLRPMRKAGIEVAAFLPSASWRERLSFNLRNHRKIVITDGALGFTGGMNIGDEYLGRNRTLGFWRDTHLRLRGPVVAQLQQVFVEDWYYATGEELTQPDVFPAPEPDGNVHAQILEGGPDCDVEVFHSVMFAAINEATQYVTIATSYFVPPESLLTALEAAAYRGVKVRLLLSGRSAYVWTKIAGRSFYNTLLKAGVEIYEYQKGLLHSKTMTIDGHWSLVGTPNFDCRSLFLNFEVAAVMYDRRIASQLERQFEEDLAESTQIELEAWQQRSSWRVASENVCRLFAPVL